MLFHQEITPATLVTIIGMTAALPDDVRPLAKVITHTADDRHLATNLRHGVQSLFDAEPVDWTDPINAALRDLVLAASAEPPSGMPTTSAALDALGMRLHAALDWFNSVVELCIADMAPPAP